MFSYSVCYIIKLSHNPKINGFEDVLKCIHMIVVVLSTLRNSNKLLKKSCTVFSLLLLQREKPYCQSTVFPSSVNSEFKFKTVFNCLRIKCLLLTHMLNTNPLIINPHSSGPVSHLLFGGFDHFGREK